MTIHKFLVALAGVVAQVIALGLVPARYEPWAAVAVALFTALGVYQVKNKPKPGPAPAGHLPLLDPPAGPDGRNPL